MVRNLPAGWEMQVIRAYQTFGVGGAATFDIVPFWDPDLHPRDEEGRWREVRARITSKPGGGAVTGDDAYDYLRTAGYSEDDAADYAMRGHLWTDDGEQFVWMPSEYGKSDAAKKASLDRLAAARELRELEEKRERIATTEKRAKPGFLEHLGMTQDEYTARWEERSNYRKRSAELREQIDRIDREARAQPQHQPDPRGDAIAKEGLAELKAVMDALPPIYRTMPDGSTRPMLMEVEDLPYGRHGHVATHGKNAFTMGTAMFGKNGRKGDSYFHMPAAEKVSELRYTIVHELGHVFDHKPWEAPYDEDKHAELVSKARHSPHMSRYGREGGIFEARAEAFAQWVLEDQFLKAGGNPLVAEHEWLYNWDLDPEEIAELKAWLIKRAKKKQEAARAG